MSTPSLSVLTSVGEPEPALSFDAIVPRRLVHRAALAEVFVTDSIRLDDDRFLVAAQLPRMHSFFNDARLPHHDLLLQVEVARQAGVLIAHRHLAVPDEHAFIFHNVDVRVLDAAATRMAGVSPSRLVLEVGVGDCQERDGVPVGFNIDVEFLLDGVRAARGSGALLFLPRADYLGLRGHVRTRRGLPATAGPAAPAPVAAEAAAVGRRDRRNVVVSAPAGDPRDGDGMACDVVVDQEHPCLFDHPLDHIPGMLLLEAYRQTAVAATCRALGGEPASALVTRCQASFTEFGELELPTRCVARVAGDSWTSPAGVTTPVEMALWQGDRRLGEGRVEVTACP